MLAFVLWAQLVAGAASAPGDSVYATPALRELVARAALHNRNAPAGFLGYRARIETELSLILRDTLGREQAVEIEQLGTRASWQRDGSYDLHVLGYRAQSRGVPYSALSFVSGYTVPWLYGDRLDMGFRPARAGRDRSFQAARAGPPRPGRSPLNFVHPFAADRDAYYHFAGGDTVTVLGVGGRSIPIVRIVVTPRPPKSGTFGAFDGEIEIDAERCQIVHMRGQMVTLSRRTTGHAAMAQRPGLVVAAYVDFVDAEVGRRYWLPATQRTEIQAALAPLGATRAVFRLVSTFRDYEVRDTTAPLDSLPAVRARIRLTYAPRDSMDGFGGWRAGLGEATSSVHAEDFADLAPDAWRADGPPRLDLYPHDLAESFRFNRVEGLYLGLAGTVRFRDAFPGLSAGVFGGYASAERTLRGGARVSLQRAPWTLGARAGRYLVSTNDFTLPFGQDPGFSALLGAADLNDYVDRRLAALSATRVLGSVDRALLSVEGGIGRDRAEQQRIDWGLFGSAGSRFGPNRGALEGGYARVAADLELNPGVSGDFLQPGIGARLHYERGGGPSGSLAWQRAELALSARKYLGPLSLAAHADGGVVAAATIPPQQLFELGGSESLPGYAWKEFAGDRAGLFRASAGYRLPLFTRPVHAFSTLYLPGFAPGLALSAQGGWAELSSPAARAAVAGLGPVGAEPVSRPTDGVRASVAVGMTFFSELVHIALARPVDHAAPWRLLAGIGPVF